MTLDEKIRMLCAERRWPQTRLAEITGLSAATANAWFHGRVRPNLATAFQLARAFGVPLDWLADDALTEIPAEPSAYERTALRYCRAIRERLGSDDAALEALADLKASLAVAPAGGGEVHHLQTRATDAPAPPGPQARAPRQSKRDADG